MAILASLAFSRADAADYRITREIDVGPMVGGVTMGPLKWSPDGLNLAYISRDVLVLSDTLGNTRRSVTFDMPAHRMEWLSKYELIIHLLKYEGNKDYQRLVKVDILKNEVELLEEFERKGARYRNDPDSFYGPFLTAKGRPFYFTNVLHPTFAGSPDDPEEPIVFPESDYDTRGGEYFEDDYILAWEDGNLVKISIATNEKRTIISADEHPLRMPIALSPDLRHYMVDYDICDLVDTSCFSLRSANIKSPPGVGFAGTIKYSFNPAGPEIIATFIYSNAAEEEVFRAGSFNYSTNTATIIDDLIGKYGCVAPVFSPDGGKIALIYDGEVLLLYREGLE